LVSPDEYWPPFVLGFYFIFPCLGKKKNFSLESIKNLDKEDDVRKYVICRTVHPRDPDKKPYTKAPKIQRLITPRRLQQKRRLKAIQRRRADKSKEEETEYK
jgi:small subunit ribosomal protein S6e